VRNQNIYSNEEDGQKLRKLLDERLQNLSTQSKCTPSPQRRIKRWVHEDVLERAQARLDKNPNAMRHTPRDRRHPFGTLKMRMGATHFFA